mmetsp:Transcript_7193/g.18305  ORF Transcript_7193/g.18305 Transcript_7193/m.18305 type:complete len:213 (-) Transcript_7193:727-1365(-)
MKPDLRLPMACLFALRASPRGGRGRRGILRRLFVCCVSFLGARLSAGLRPFVPGRRGLAPHLVLRVAIAARRRHCCVVVRLRRLEVVRRAVPIEPRTEVVIRANPCLDRRRILGHPARFLHPAGERIEQLAELNHHLRVVQTQVVLLVRVSRYVEKESRDAGVGRMLAVLDELKLFRHGPVLVVLVRLMRRVPRKDELVSDELHVAHAQSAT